jgi:ABC-type phosphate transport system permease subunit
MVEQMVVLGLGLVGVFSGVFSILIGGLMMGLALALLIVPYFLFTRESQSLPAPDAPARVSRPVPVR